MSEVGGDCEQARRKTESDGGFPVAADQVAGAAVRRRRKAGKTVNLVAEFSQLPVGAVGGDELAVVSSMGGSRTPMSRDGSSLLQVRLPGATAGWQSMWRRAVSLAEKVWQWLQARRRWQLGTKRLALCETVSLGEKRFLALIRVDGQHFLVGGAPSSVSLLAQLGAPGEFSGVLEQRRQVRRKKA